NSIKFDLYFKPILPFISIELYLKDAHQLVSSWYYGHVCETSTTDDTTDKLILKEFHPIEKDFWKIIEEEKQKGDHKIVSSNKKKTAAECEAMAQAEIQANTKAQMFE
ncbi:unnamed protein product, partial [Rotaria sp. Silwood2]